VKGREGDEKVVVTIERRMGTVPEGEDEAQTRSRIWTEDEALAGEASVIENRDLIFMRTKTAAQIEADQALFGEPGRIVKGVYIVFRVGHSSSRHTNFLSFLSTAPTGATLRHSITPNKSLLFRFSALTFNAHSIHLDKTYTQNEEGYRNLLVHGPLTLTLLLSVLERHFHGLGLRVEHIEYKNLAPVFVDEVLTVCGKEKNGGGGAWDVWIEGPRGGLAVRGTVGTSSCV
jgi:acyl dehydratase